MIKICGPVVVFLFFHTFAYGAAMSSYALKSTVDANDTALINDSASSNATKRAAMSTIKDYVLSDVIDFSATSPLSFNSTTGVLSLSDVIDFSATSPLSFNSTTGVLSLTPWASQSALETWLGWSFPKNNEGVVSVSTTTATGNINIDGVSADHYFFNNGASDATYTPVITSPPASGERGVILTVGGGAGVITMTWTNVSPIGAALAATTTANKYSHYFCFIPASGNAKCKIIEEASDN